MLLYCKDGVVIATHDDNQNVPDSVYGSGVVVIPYAGQLVERVGPAPSSDRPDLRPYAVPAIDDVGLIEVAARCRWISETGGVVVNGLHVPTNDRAKALITGAAASLSDTATVKFKSGTAWVDLTGAQMKALRDAVTTHVQACFAKEAEVAAAISAGTITTVEQVVSAGWPEAPARSP